MHPRIRIESLETRVMLAATLPIKIIDGFEIATINWQGQEAEMFAGRWMLKLDGYSGQSRDQQTRAARSVSRATNAFAVDRFLADGLFLVNGPKQMQPAEVASRLSRVAGYQFITPDFRYSVDLIPNDSLFNNLWGLHNVGQTGGTNDVDIDAPEAWNSNTGSSSVVVGGADTGVDFNHPDLNDNIYINPGEIPGNFIDDDLNGYPDDVRGWDFFFNDSDASDDGDHGSHTAGTMSAEGNNGQGISGVSWSSKILALKIGSGASISASAAVAAQAYIYNLKTRLTNPANVRAVNHSWGGSGFDPSMNFYIGLCNDANIMTVCSSGNNNSNNDASPRYPSSYDQPNVIAVANMTSTGNREFTSNWGAFSVDLAAPGTDVLSTIRVSSGSYAFFTGTSMAAPHVAGAVAVLAAVSPSSTAVQIKNAILQSVDPRAAFAGITVTGGSLNLNGAINRLAVPPAPNTPDLTAGSDTGQFSNDNITSDNTPTFNGSGPQGNTIKIYANGNLVGQAVIPPTQIFNVTTSPLADGPYNITATLTNAVGEGPASGALPVTIDTVGPNVTSSPLNYLTSPHTLSVVFNEEVGWTIGDTDFGVQNLDNPGAVPVTSSYNSGNTTATLSFTGVSVLPDADYRLTVFGADIRDVAGNFLVGLADYTSDFFFMMGDANHDRAVNLIDFNIVAANFGQSPRNFGQGDFNYDGTTNLIDFNILASRFGTILAGPDALPGGSVFGQDPITRDGSDRMDDPLDSLLA